MLKILKTEKDIVIFRLHPHLVGHFDAKAFPKGRRTFPYTVILLEKYALHPFFVGNNFQLPVEKSDRNKLSI